MIPGKLPRKITPVGQKTGLLLVATTDSAGERLDVRVVVIAWDQDHYGIRGPLKNVKERHGYRHAGTAIEGLGNNARVIHVAQFLTVVSFVCTRHDEHLFMNREKRFETGPCLGEKALFPEDGTKLFWPGVASDL